LRILFVSHYAIPHVGGIETSIDVLGRELAHRGHDVVHLASDAQPSFETLGDSSVRLRTIPAANFLERRLGLPYPLFGPRLVSAIREEVPQADVVNAHGLLFQSSALALAWARMRNPLGPARVLTEHVGFVSYSNRALDLTQQIAIRSLGRLSVSNSEAVIVTNERVRSEIKRLGYRREIAKLQHGVDPRDFSPRKSADRRALRHSLGWDDKPRVLFVGRIVAKKRIEIAIEAARLGGQEWHLVVTGPSARPQQGSVEFTGPRSQPELASMYQAADALLLTAIDEGFPMVIQEAMASGLPVVLTDANLHREYLAESGWGATLSEASPAQVDATIRRVIEAGERARLSASDWASRKFLVTRTADTYERVFEQVLARRADK
jgi:glycosyltransferase involved in cell wall biosynthesis